MARKPLRLLLMVRYTFLPRGALCTRSTYALASACGLCDPQVAREKGRDACCDVVNRGVAAWGWRIFVGTIDGRLVALDSASGEVDWEVMTVDESLPYTITGAPRVVKGKVLIGNGGAEYGVRGYVTAYDTESGEQAWRFYTVPGNRRTATRVT